MEEQDTLGKAAKAIERFAEELKFSWTPPDGSWPAEEARAKTEYEELCELSVALVKLGIEFRSGSMGKVVFLPEGAQFDPPVDEERIINRVRAQIRDEIRRGLIDLSDVFAERRRATR